METPKNLKGAGAAFLGVGVAFLVIAILVLLFYALKPVMAKRKAGKA